MEEPIFKIKTHTLQNEEKKDEDVSQSIQELKICRDNQENTFFSLKQLLTAPWLLGEAAEMYLSLTPIGT